jgi:hypothetical protein
MQSEMDAVKKNRT